MKGPRHAEHREHRKERPHRIGADNRQRQQGQRAYPFQRVGKRHDQPPPEAVGHRAGDQHQNKRGKKLRQPDKTEVKRVTADIVNLPADCHRHDLCGKRVGKARRPVAPVALVAKGLIAVACRNALRRFAVGRRTGFVRGVTHGMVPSGRKKAGPGGFPYRQPGSKP